MALTKVTGHVVLPTTNIEFHNTKSTGIVTFTDTTQSTSTTTGALQIAGGVGIVKNLNVGGNLNVTGNLTYTDVDNINSVGIITANAGVNVLGNSTFTGDVELISTDSGAAAAPTLKLQRDSSSPAAQDILGRIMFGGKDSTPNDEQYAMVAGKIINPGAGGEHGAIQITTRKNSAHVITANLTSTDYELLNGTNLSVDGNITGNGNFILKSTDGGTAAAPELTLHRNSGSPANNDYLGEIHFRGKDSGGSSADYATITGKILSTTNGAERGILEFSHLKSGTETITGRWRDDSLQLLNGTNLTVAGSTTLTGNVGIASNSPAERLVVQGDVNSFLAFDKDGGGFDGTSGGALVLGSVFDYSGARLGLYADNSGGGRLMTKTGQSLYLGTNNTRRVSINNIGYVGINTTNAAKLFTIRHVDGRHHQFSYDDNIITMKGANNNNNPETMRFIADTLRFNTGTSGSGTEALRISNSGKILTGGETATNEISDGGIHIKTSNNGGNTHALILENHGSSTNTQVILKFAPTTSTTNDRFNSINVVNVDGQNKFDTSFYTCPGGTPLEAMRIDNQQRLLIGHTANVARHEAQNAALQISGTARDDSSAAIGRWSADTNPARLEFSKSRNATIGNHTAVAADDELGHINFAGSDGTRYLGAAFIKGTATTPIADYDCAGFLSFGTNYGTTSPTERVRITKEGYVHIGTASALGTMRVGGQAITGQDQDPIVKVYTSSSSQWLAQLRSDHTTGNGVFLRAGNSSSTYTLYATGYDENKSHFIVRGDGKISINHVANQDSPSGILDVRSEIGPHPLGVVFRKDYGGDTSDDSHKLALTIWGQDHNDLDHTTQDAYGPMIGFGTRNDDSAPNTGDIRAAISYRYNGTLTFHTESGGSVSDGSNERLRIAGNGKIGIGEKTPVAPLTLNLGDTGANTTFANAELIRIEGYGTTNSKSGIGFGRYNGGASGYVPAAFIGAQTGTWSGYTNCHLVFATRNTTGDDNATERFRIQNDGRIKFVEDPVQRNSGAVDSFSGDGAYMQHYVSRNGSTYRRNLDIAAVGDGSWGCAIRFSTNTDGNATSTERMHIDHHGTVKIHRSPSTTSGGYSTLAHMDANSMREHVRYISAGSSSQTINLMRVRRHYWGAGFYKIWLKQVYYVSTNEAVWWLNGHGRNTGGYSPSWNLGHEDKNGSIGSSTVQITANQNTGAGNDYAGYVDVYATISAYHHYIVHIEAMGSVGFSQNTSSVSENGYALF